MAHDTQASPQDDSADPQHAAASRSQSPTQSRRKVILIALSVLLLTAAGVRIGLFLQDNGLGSGSGSAALARAGAGDSGIRSFGDFEMSDLRVPRDELRRGGPPPDGIPALVTAPAAEAGTENPLDLPPTPVLPADRAGDLYGESRVFSVTIDGQTRGYPLAVLNWHEIVNDVLGDEPIAVVYCPLCDSASVVSRSLEAGEDAITTTFGVSGLLYNSNVVLYDRATRSLWSQVKLEAISGPHAGDELEHVGRWSMMTAKRFAADFPEATVLAEDTGSRRNYARNPYADYFSNDSLMFPVSHQDDRLPNKTRVVGLRHGDDAVAVPLSHIREHQGNAMRVKVGGETVQLQVGATGASVRTENPDIASVHTFWFAWAASHPETRIAGGDS